MAWYDNKCGAKKMSYNVPAVYDVFAVAIKELHSNASNCKNVVEKNPTKTLSTD
jgi:hypothetical protein